MKCDACGAPVEDGRCTYCGKVCLNDNEGDVNNINVNFFVEKDKKTKLSEEKWFQILLLILLFPVGLYLILRDINAKERDVKLSKRKWFVIFMLIIFPPVGMVLMWKNMKWNNAVKVIVTIFCVSVCYCYAFSIVEVAKNPSSINSTEVGEEKKTDSKTAFSDRLVLASDFDNSCEVEFDLI